MHRTRAARCRPAASQPIEALALGVVAGVVGLRRAVFFVNALTAALGAITLGSYVLVYTPLKRVTTLNTIVGAIPARCRRSWAWRPSTGDR